MTTANADQIADWNGAQGRRWAELQRQTDGIVARFGQAALARAAARPGERAIDVGCGCGDTTIELARQVGEAGWVLGVDVSQPMLEVARAHAAGDARLRVEFREADASDAALPEGIDLMFSRFGVMFFDQPLPALRHLRGSMRSGGRFVFVCWRAPRDNPWAMTPLVAARKALGVTPLPVDPNAPGPFAFADEERLRGLLASAGFEHIDLQRFDAQVVLGPTPRAAAENATRIGPTSRFAREVGDASLPAIVEAIERALAPVAAADGQVSLDGSTWIVSASNP